MIRIGVAITVNGCSWLSSWRRCCCSGCCSCCCVMRGGVLCGHSFATAARVRSARAVRIHIAAWGGRRWGGAGVNGHRHATSAHRRVRGAGAGGMRRSRGRAIRRGRLQCFVGELRLIWDTHHARQRVAIEKDIRRQRLVLGLKNGDKKRYFHLFL